MLSSCSQVRGYFTTTFLGAVTYVTHKPGQISKEQDTEQMGRLPACLLGRTLNRLGQNTSQESSTIVRNIPLPLPEALSKKEQSFKKHCLLYSHQSPYNTNSPCPGGTRSPRHRNLTNLKIGKAHLTVERSTSHTWSSTIWNKVALPLPILPSPQRAWMEPFISATT